MSLHEKIKQKRESLGWSQTRLADAAGTNQQTVDRIEKGSNSKYLIAVMRAVGVSDSGADFILEAGGERRVIQLKDHVGHYKPPPPLFDPVDTVPLYSSAEGGKGHFIASTDEIGRAPRYDVLMGAKHAYAILITGTSMAEAYEPGDRALVNPHLPLSANVEFIFYTEKDGEATATIKRLVSWTDKEWTVRQFNPAKTFKLDRGLWIYHHRVVGNLKRSFGGKVPFGAF